MSQYPDEKDPRAKWVQPASASHYPKEKSDWVYPGQEFPGASSSQPQPAQEDDDPPPVPPPDYGYAVSHPAGRPPNDHKTPPETTLSPPPGSGVRYAAQPDAGPSASQDQGQNGMSLGAFFGSKGTPPMWGRPPPQQLPYNAFPPMTLLSNGTDLSDGFPDLPPPTQLNPHPFATHDVTEEDWKRFLADIKKAGSLSPAQRIKSNLIPLVTGMSFLTGFMATFAIEKRMKGKNRNAAGDLIDHWNHYFFGPRRMEAALCQASERLSGRIGAAPVGERRRDEDSSSDDSSSDSEDYRHGRNRGYDLGQARRDMWRDRREAIEEMRTGRRGERWERRADRRADRQERRTEKRARRAERRERKARGDYQQPYQLVVTAI